MELFCRLVVYKSKRKTSFAAELAVHFEVGLSEEEHSAAVGELGCDFTYVTRADNVLETHIVYSAIECSAAFKLVLYEESTALGHDFTLDYSWNYRIAREVASAEKLILTYRVLCMSHAV